MVEDWSLPIETIPCDYNPEPLPCEVITDMCTDTHLFIRIGKERIVSLDENELDEIDPWFIPGVDGDTGRRVGSRYWWYLREGMGVNEPNLPTLRNVAA